MRSRIRSNWKILLLVAGWGCAAWLRADGDFQFAAGDANRDGFSDFAVIGKGEWYVWMSGQTYVMQGPYDIQLCGGRYAVGDLDGDRQADLAMLSGADWYIWCSGSQYRPEGPIPCGVSNGVPVLHDFDGDGRDDPCVVVNASWTVWHSGRNYARQPPFGFDLGAVGPLIPLAWKWADGHYYGTMRPDGIVRFRKFPYSATYGPVRLPHGVPVTGHFDSHGEQDLAVVQSRTNGFWVYPYLSGENWNQSGPYPMCSDRVPGIAGMVWLDRDGCFAAVNVHDIGPSSNALVHVNSTRLYYTNQLSFVTHKGWRVKMPLSFYYAPLPGVKPGDSMTLTVFPNSPSFPGQVYRSNPTRMPGLARITRPANGAKLYAGQPVPVSWTAASDRRGCLVCYFGDDTSASPDDRTGWYIQYAAAPLTTHTIPGSVMVKGSAEFGVAALNGDVQALLASEDTNDSFFITGHYTETEAVVETPPPPPTIIAKTYKVRQDGLTFKVRETDPLKMPRPGRALVDIRMRKHKISVAFVMAFDSTGAPTFEWNKLRLLKRKGKRYEVVIPCQPYSTIVIGTHDAKFGGITYTPAP